MFAATSESLFWKSLSPWQNFPPLHVSPIQTDLILCNVLQGQNAIMETKIFTKISQYTWSNLLLRHVTANWGSDLSSLCVALTCQLVCSDLKPMTAYCEFRALNTLQCYLMSLYCSHDYYMKPTYVIKVNWYPTKRQNQIQMECFREISIFIINIIIFKKIADKNRQTRQIQKYKITKNNFVPLNNLVQDVIC